VRRCPRCGGWSPGEGLECSLCGQTPPRGEAWWDYLPADREGAPGYQASHFEKIQRTEAGSAWFLARNRLVLRALQEHFPDTHAYLEAGCGTGFVLSAVERKFPAWRVTGLEPFGEGLRAASRRLERGELVRADLLDPPWKGAFDLVGVYDVLEHLEDDRAALTTLGGVLRGGGGILATVPQHPELWSLTDEAAGHVRRYRPGELEGKMRDAGFTVLYSTSFVSLPLPALWFSRRIRKGHEVTDELALPAAVDRGLGLILGLERLLLRAGMSFPWGGSRLVAARKSEDK